MKVTHARNREAAVAQARAAVLAGRRIFVRDLDTGNWFEISDCSHSSRKAGSSAQAGGDAAADTETNVPHDRGPLGAPKSAQPRIPAARPKSP